MKKAIKFIASALILAMALILLAAPAMAKDDLLYQPPGEEASEMQMAEGDVEATEEITADENDPPAVVNDDASIPDGEPAGENEPSLWNKFWNAMISLINGTNARDAVVTACSILGAVIMVFARSLVSKLTDKMTGFTAANGAKVNELVKGFNENAAQIATLKAKFEEKFGEIYDKCLTAAEKTSEKDARVAVTNDAVLALAGMLNTIYTSSTTIPDAAKEIIREKYAGVLHAVNKVSEAREGDSTSEQPTDAGDTVKTE